MHPFNLDLRRREKFARNKKSTLSACMVGASRETDGEMNYVRAKWNVHLFYAWHPLVQGANIEPNLDKLNLNNK